MPKKFAGENSKAVAARIRKAAVEEAEAAKKQKELEDEYWKDNDKCNQRKQQRKEEKDRRRQELLNKKAGVKLLMEEEINNISPKKIGPDKVTRAQLQSYVTGKSNKLNECHLTQPLEENLNRFVVDVEVAQTVEEAISVLTPSGALTDMQPELKLRAAFSDFQTANLPRIKAENPTLRLSQIKQLLWKEWMRSSENPVNKKIRS